MPAKLSEAGVVIVRQIICNRCGSVALGRASVVEATAGELRRFLPEPLHLCGDCGEGLVAFLRHGKPHQTTHATPRRGVSSNGYRWRIPVGDR
jgi:hypothetical protein